MNYIEARHLITNYLKKHYPKIVSNDEIEAIITHWLLNPDICPPYISKKAFNACRQLFGLSPISKENEFLVREEPSPYQLKFDLTHENIPYPAPGNSEFRFIDLFAGIGGFRIAFQNAGGKCVFTSEWDKHAKKTYEANFGEVPYGDIRKTNKKEIPEHDVLCAGFPCQPFSLAGVSKKNSLGRKHGFADETQGTLFFEILEILKLKRPKAFFLENVKNLLTHDKKHTFEVIRHSLGDDLGYVINWIIVDGAKWVPQHRERIFIVGFNPAKIRIKKEEITIPDKPGNGYKYSELSDIIQKKVDGYTLGPGTWATLERHKKHHAAEGNGFGYGLHKLPIPEGTVTRTISARYHKDGAEILIEQRGQRPRRLTVEEAMQLQGYDPKKFVFPVSQTQAYKQIGNSVVVPAIEATAKEIVKILKDKKRCQ
ncbi:MAG TPA: DNA (cytosine-5-)-methyltransferase [Bacteroidetes bacterium]|nr:DNA (cytosine-5-)-methyltransferase [Bacteroidota bacterium]